MTTPVAFDHEWLTGAALASLPRPRLPEPARLFTCFWCGSQHGDGHGFQCAECAPLHPDHNGALVNVHGRDVLNLRCVYAAATYRAVLEWIGEAFDRELIAEARAVVQAARVTPLRELAPVLRALATQRRIA